MSDVQKAKGLPQKVEGEVVPAQLDEDFDEISEEDFEDDEEFSDEEDFEDDDDFEEEEFDEDDDYDDNEEVDLQLQARQLADVLSNSGLLSQVSAMFGGGGGVIPGEAAFARGRGLQTLGDLEGAAESYLDAIEQNPLHLRAYTALGQILLAMDKPDDAIPFLEKAMELDPYDAGSYLYLGYAYYAKQDYAVCVDYFGKVVKLEPTHHLALNNKGFCQYLIGDLEGAAVSFSKAGDVGSDRSYYNLGMVQLLRGKEKEGWQAYDDAADLDPYGSQIADHLSDLKTAIDRYPKAASLVAEAQRKLLERVESMGIASENDR
jgi:tetratricopeptide (TPR) repeat protein